MTNEEDILRRLGELERENLRLRKLAGESVEPKKTETYVSMFKGRPVITFTGAFRPFTIGLRKAAIVIEKIEDIKHFVTNNKKYMAAIGEDTEDPPIAPTP